MNFFPQILEFFLLLFVFIVFSNIEKLQLCRSPCESYRLSLFFDFESFLPVLNYYCGVQTSINLILKRRNLCKYCRTIIFSFLFIYLFCWTCLHQYKSIFFLISVCFEDHFYTLCQIEQVREMNEKWKFQIQFQF